MLGVPYSVSSHAAAEACNRLLFEPIVILNQVRYFKKILKSNNALIMLSVGKIKRGYLFDGMFNYLKDICQVDFMENDLDVIKARLVWMQRHAVHTGRDIT